MIQVNFLINYKFVIIIFFIDTGENIAQDDDKNYLFEIKLKKLIQNNFLTFSFTQHIPIQIALHDYTESTAILFMFEISYIFGIDE